MALTDDLMQRMHRHLDEEDTISQRLEFRRLLRDNRELAEAYHALRNARIMQALDEQRTELASVIQEVYVETPVPPTSLPVPNPSPSLIGQIGTYLNEVFNGLQARLTQPKWAGLALGCLLLIGVGAIFYVRQQAEERLVGEAELKKDWANPFNSNMGSALITSCDPDLQQRYYPYRPTTPNAELQQRIVTLKAQTNLAPPCRAYYLGRTYLAIGDYAAAINTYQMARQTNNPTLQEMATYDLALTYLLNDDPTQCRATLRSRPIWNTSGIRETVDRLYEKAE